MASGGVAAAVIQLAPAQVGEPIYESIMPGYKPPWVEFGEQEAPAM